MALEKDGRALYTIDAKASLFTVQAFAAGIVAVVAHSPKFAIRGMSGEIRFDAAAPQNASVQLTINVGSLEIMDEVRASERKEIERVMFYEVLEENKYPRVEYKSTRVTPSKLNENVYKANIAGELTLHGATRGVGMEAQVVVGEDTLRSQGTFSILQSDYGMKIASVAGGTLKIKDELKFAYFLIGRRKS